MRSIFLGDRIEKRIKRQPGRCSFGTYSESLGEPVVGDHKVSLQIPDPGANALSGVERQLQLFGRLTESRLRCLWSVTSVLTLPCPEIRHRTKSEAALPCAKGGIAIRSPVTRFDFKRRALLHSFHVRLRKFLSIVG